MVKFVVFCTKVITATIIAVLFSSCHANIDWENDIDGSGKVITQRSNAENTFFKIDIRRDFLS